MAAAGDATFIGGPQDCRAQRAATMLGPLKTLISSLVEEARRPGQFEDQNCRLATAALLIRVASVDGDMSAARRGKLHAVLMSAFELDEVAAARLIDEAAAADRSAIDLYRFTRPLKDALDEEGRRRIVKMMWEIIFVDRSANEFENNIVWRVADLLAVPARQRIELRRRIAADRAVPAGCLPTGR